MALLQALLGIGFLLFIHELGHFLAARACGVRVEVFALGMGPRLFGFKRNGTDYRIAAFPIGGYVKMAGDDLSGSGANDELYSKPPWQRFFIFSGGILMNFLFALIMIPVLFRIGVPMQPPVVGQISQGSPAWQAGILEGDRLSNLNGRTLHSFSDFASSVALSDVDEILKLQVDRGGESHLELKLQAQYNEVSGMPTVGVNRAITAAVIPDSVATRAGLLATDQLLSINGVSLDQPGATRLLLTEAIIQGQDLELTFLRDGLTASMILQAEQIESGSRAQLGVFEARNQVRELRPGHDTGLEIGDLVLSAGEQAVRSVEVIQAAALGLGQIPELTVQRGAAILKLQPQMSGSEFASMVWLDSEPGTLRITVRPDGPAAAAGLMNGDQIMRAGSNAEILDSFADLRNMLARVQEQYQSANPDADTASASPMDAFPLMVLREGKTLDIAVIPGTSPSWDFGLAFQYRTEILQEKSAFKAISTGLAQAKSMVRDAFLSFERIVTGRISTKNLGGIITISRTTHSVATVGFVPLLFFLCMISIHLGVLNLLPIPALDGGHLLFLLVESIRGKPVSERVQIWFNLGGFVLIMGLVIFVTFLDIKRLVP
jgi:regulator of sigma E protease